MKVCAGAHIKGYILSLAEQGSEQMILKRRPYLNLKGGGNNSMVIKRGISEDVYDIALQRLNDMVKAKLPEL